MSSIWGEHLRISVYGESHGPGIGVVLDGFPPGMTVDPEQLRRFLRRRAPGRTPWSTPRQETDQPEILSGVWEGVTTGTPIHALIRNKDTRSRDYAAMKDLPRPGHADYTGRIRYRGFNDPRGGGHFSGRLTAPIVFAGALCAQWLAARGIRVYAHAAAIGGILDDAVDPVRPDEDGLREVAERAMPVLNAEAGQRMADAVVEARRDGNSLGGVVQCVALGVPPGLGNPLFGGMEARLASLLLSVPAVKGVEFGDGFAVAQATGADNNDAPVMEDGQVRMRTNHGGGMDGGIANGMPVLLRVAFKPTPSIARPQPTVRLDRMESAEITVPGRHDPCIVPRAVPVVEAAVALVLTDLMLGGMPE